MTDQQAMIPSAAPPDITVDEREYYLRRVGYACAAAANAGNPAVASIHLGFAAEYLMRLLASVEKQLA